MERPSAILIAGPTASGKSGLASRLARRFGGVVVNADSMQVYEGLKILTARPSEAEMGQVPHRLYGHVPPDTPYSVGHWAREVAPLLTELAEAGKVPVFCGGTGLYFKALTGGLDEMPKVPDTLRADLRRRLEKEGLAALHAELARRDPEAAARIGPRDPQRTLRALELAQATGRPLATLQVGSAPALIDAPRALKIVLTPERSLLRDRIAARFDAMLAAGALDEAAAFARRPGALDGLASKAIGLSELLAVKQGTSTPEEARVRAIDRTRHYAKRQETWFRNQLGSDWRRIADPALIAA